MSVKALINHFNAEIQLHIDTKTKPQGALGLLETIAMQLANIQSQQSLTKNISLNNPIMIVFAGDHGINQHGLSIARSEVTHQMVLNFLGGGAAINCFCRSNHIDLNVVDCGILTAIPPDMTKNSVLIEQRLGAGTNDFSKQAAMTIDQVEQGFTHSETLVNKYLMQKRDILLLGEMGIANTSAATAIMVVLTQYSVEQCIGIGTGITDEQLILKKQLIQQGIDRFALLSTDISSAENIAGNVKQVLAELGGFEIVQMVGTILSAAKAQLPIMIDGFIVSVAALAAVRIDNNVGDYLIFSHQSEEQGHQLLLVELNSQPLLSLGLRLGEGTGAALAYPLVKAAVSFYNDMTSFESAGVTV